MDIAILVARLLAPIYLCVGLGMFLSQGYYKKSMTEIMESPVATYMSGTLALLAGVLIVIYHNIWESSWTLIITIIGWLSLIKGVLLLLIPEPFMDLFSPMVKGKYMPIIGFIALALGLILGYFGFIA